MTLELTDAFDTICTSVQNFLSPTLTQIKYWGHEWPDPSWFEDTDANFPSVLFADISTTGAAKRSKFAPFAVDSGSTYYETLRLQLQIQVTLVTATPDDRVSIGSTIVQSLVNQRQLPLTNGQTSIMRLRGDVSPKGEQSFFLRHMTFEFQARVLRAEQGWPATTITPRQTIT